MSRYIYRHRYGVSKLKCLLQPLHLRHLRGRFTIFIDRTTDHQSDYILSKLVELTYEKFSEAYAK